MTPRTVVFSLHESLLVQDYFEKYHSSRFSRIPIYAKDRDHVTGFVLRSDLLLAHARGNSENSLEVYRRDLPALPGISSLQVAFEAFIEKHSHIMLVVDEYGSMSGILTLEDILETILGIEIIDEGDQIDDMRKLARRLWRKRADRMGLKVDGMED